MSTRSDVVPFDQGPPVGLGRCPPVPDGGPAHGGRVTSADRGEDRAERQIEGAAHGAPALGVGGAHEGITDHADAQGRLPALRSVRLLGLSHTDVLLVLVVMAQWGVRGGICQRKPVGMYWSTLSLSTMAE